MFQIRSQSTSTLRCSANFAAAVFADSSIEASLSASRLRWSSRHSAVSTTEVTMPGFVTTLPIVQTPPPCSAMS